MNWKTLLASLTVSNVKITSLQISVEYTGRLPGAVIRQCHGWFVQWINSGLGCMVGLPVQCALKTLTKQASAASPSFASSS